MGSLWVFKLGLIVLMHYALCMNFDVVPTFAQVERRKARKWRKSADNYQREVLVEELRSKQSHLLHLKGLCIRHTKL